MFSLKNHAENETEKQVRELFMFFRKVSHDVLASGLKLSYNKFLMWHDLEIKVKKLNRV